MSLRYRLLELRALAYERLDLEQSYFIVRHQYNSPDRQLLDLMYVFKRGAKGGLIHRLRYTRLKHMHRQTLNSNEPMSKLNKLSSRSHEKS